MSCYPPRHHECANMTYTRPHSSGGCPTLPRDGARVLKIGDGAEFRVNDERERESAWGRVRQVAHAGRMQGERRAVSEVRCGCRCPAAAPKRSGSSGVRVVHPVNNNFPDNNFSNNFSLFGNTFLARIYYV